MTAGERLRKRLGDERPLPLVGIYDAYSASLAAASFDGLFLSGFSFGAAAYGLPDAGFVTWTDLVSVTRRIRAIVPGAHLVVDLDDGYGDPGVAAEAARSLEEAGASGVVLEDQQRPKRCGHLDGKRVAPLERYLETLEAVLDARRDLVVVARTDADEPAERLRRARAFDRTAADAVLVEGLADVEFLRALRAEVGKPLAFNQIAGGRGAPRSWSELASDGVRLVLHSTPCLFAAHQAIRDELAELSRRDGSFELPSPPRVSLADVVDHLESNASRRRGKD